MKRLGDEVIMEIEKRPRLSSDRHWSLVCAHYMLVHELCVTGDCMDSPRLHPDLALNLFNGMYFFLTHRLFNVVVWLNTTPVVKLQSDTSTLLLDCTIVDPERVLHSKVDTHLRGGPKKRGRNVGTGLGKHWAIIATGRDVDQTEIAAPQLQLILQNQRMTDARFQSWYPSRQCSTSNILNTCLTAPYEMLSVIHIVLYRTPTQRVLHVFDENLNPHNDYNNGVTQMRAVL